MRGTVLTALTVATFLVLSPAFAAGEPTSDTHWLSLINTTHFFPDSLTVTVIPPGVVGIDAAGDLTWIGPEAAHELPATQAVLEAIEYWAWAIDQYESQWPHLAGLRYDVQVVGVDVPAIGFPFSDIVVSTAMVLDPAPFIFHAGLGLPTYPSGALLGDMRTNPQTLCTVWNTGTGVERDDDALSRLRNLVVHEFGHCLGAGHTGTSLGFEHCSDAYGCFDQHPTDVMSSVHGEDRQCLSNLNVQSLADGYHWLATGTTWKAHAGETFMLKTEYETVCLPSGMSRF